MLDRCFVIILMGATGCLEAPQGAADASSGGDASAGSCMVSAFSDDFENSDYEAVWTSSFEHDSGMLTTDAGQGLITLTDSSDWAGFISPSRNLTGTCTYGEVIDVPNLAEDSAAEAWFSLSPGEDSGVFIRLTRNLLTCNEQINGEITSSVELGSFDPVAHRWWRLRDEGETMACEVSRDGQTWDPLGAVATDLDLSRAKIAWIAGTWDAMADPGVFRIDNVNDSSVTPAGRRRLNRQAVTAPAQGQQASH